MVISPARNCADFFKTRPPLVLFLLCLLLMLVGTFLFAFYLKNEEKTLDTDARQNWINLVRVLSQTNVCLTPEKKVHKEEDILKYNNEQVSVFTTIESNLAKFEKLGKIHILYDLTGFQPICSDFSMSNNGAVTVDFIIEQNKTTCVKITGPRAIMPKFTEPACHQPTNKTVLEEVFLLSSPKTGTCIDKTKILFSTGNLGNFDIFLSDIDKNNVYQHLLWLGYCLTLFLMLMLLFAAFYGHHHHDQRNYY